MKKVVAAVLVTGLAFTGLSAPSAMAASGNTMQSVKQLQQDDDTLEGVTLGQSIESVLKGQDKSAYSFRPDGKEHYYEFEKDNGTLLVTANGKKDHGKVTHISMSYKSNGPTYKAVKKAVSDNAVYREHYNSVSGNFGYIEDNNVSYQFGSDSPDDTRIKLYRIDIEK
ncbi:hypothetical protein JCM2421_18940 [Staphylococcus auricularis]|uniref:Lipoprotein n=1 Tax=Staphylococcus auricularis TaxID=29379 RepID=A0AAP8PQ57_9STAP|nr:hypothetical protein [Staphylococcus auricularis]MDC6327722.1 hypothetical protein [Staphylococcus auricularis]MDN4533674.1 hypothetical protein [Staphylococcus auricularis]PNZ68819.1 hypothetical protein CD158_02505 [Staphylococcus auricularis]QPT06465.1 hypothetical protein I6G39_02085 [Staphylococcus auricularis]SQJ16220.1 exported protein [Staphylococcus auricularis]